MELSPDRLHIVAKEKDLVYGVDDIDEKALMEIKESIKNNIGLSIQQMMSDEKIREVIEYLSKDKPLNYVIDYVDSK